MFKVKRIYYFKFLLKLLRICLGTCFFINFIALKALEYIVGYGSEVESKLFAFLGAIIGTNFSFFSLAIILLPACAISKNISQKSFPIVILLSSLPGVFLYWYEPNYLSLICSFTTVISGVLFYSYLVKESEKDGWFKKSRELIPTIIFTPIIAAIAVIIYFQFFVDESLNPEVNEWLALSNRDVTLENNGNVYRYGFGTEENKEPYEEGIALVRNIEVKKRLNEKIDTLNKSSFSEKGLGLSEDIDCNLRKFECMDFLLSQADELEELLSENQLLLNRYRELTHYQHFTPIYSTHSSYPHIGFSAIAAARKIFIFNSIHLASNGRFEEAISNVINDIALLRRIMKNELSLISHVINIVYLREDFYLLSFLLGNAPKSFSVSNIELIPLIDDSETGKQNLVWEREFSKTVVSIMEEVNPAYEPGNLVTRLMYKPNITLNRLLKEYKKIKHPSLLYEKEGTNDLKFTYKDDLNIDMDYSNFIGWSLYATSIPRFVDIATEYYYLNAHIQLLNFQLKNYQAVKNDEIYYSNSASKVKPDVNLGLKAYKNKNLICFPQENEEKGNTDGICIFLKPARS